ncbi:MAG: hypothetical protein AB1758_24025, partial [Candidatus Eremiobacterota bacterium]
MTIPPRFTRPGTVQQAFRQTEELLVQLRDSWDASQVDRLSETSRSTLSGLGDDVAGLGVQADWAGS